MTRRAPRWTGHDCRAVHVGGVAQFVLPGGRARMPPGPRRRRPSHRRRRRPGRHRARRAPPPSPARTGWSRTSRWPCSRGTACPPPPSPRLFNSPRTLLIVRPRGGVPDSLVPLATKVQSFASFATMQAAIQGSTLEPGVKYVLYDNEDWPFTPSNEQAAPFTYRGPDALALAHAHGLQVIFTPAANLSPDPQSRLHDLEPARVGQEQVLRLSGPEHGGPGRGGLGHRRDPGSAGRGSNQGSPPSSAKAALQARAAAPSHPVLLGITSAIPGSGAVSPSTLTGVVAATRSLVDGYWLNVPGDVTPVPELRTGRCRSRGVVPRVVRRIGGLGPAVSGRPQGSSATVIAQRHPTLHAGFDHC